MLDHFKQVKFNYKYLSKSIVIISISYKSKKDVTDKVTK